MLSVGAMIPFLTALAEPSLIFEFEQLRPLISLLGAESPEGIILPFIIVFIVAVTVAAALRILLFYSITRVSYALGSDIGCEIYAKTIRQPYLVHIDRNSSDLINSLLRKTDDVIGGVVIPALLLVSSSLVLLGILSVLLSIDAVTTLTCIAVFGFLYWCLLMKTRRYLGSNSKTIVQESSKLVKVVQETLGGIRDVILDGNQQYYSDLFITADKKLRFAQGNNSIISGSPKHIIEAMGMIALAAISYWLTLTVGSIASFLPILGAIALGAQRMLPNLQQIYASISHIRGAQESLKDILFLLDQEVKQNEPQKIETSIDFKKKIEFCDVSFRYFEGGDWVLKNVNVTIPKGHCVGIVGASGSGKSTLCDSLMGLISPSSGMVWVDDVELSKDKATFWQDNIAHVPETIFLTDASIAENIAFGMSKQDIDLDKVKTAARMAQLDLFIESLPLKYSERVGERGVRLSGGQRQRIGLARALFKQTNVIVFDEATSALDSKTESDIVRTIAELTGPVTKIMVAHRLTTLANCDVIYTVSGGVFDTGMRYEEFMSKQGSG